MDLGQVALLGNVIEPAGDVVARLALDSSSGLYREMYFFIRVRLLKHRVGVGNVHPQSPSTSKTKKRPKFGANNDETQRVEALSDKSPATKPPQTPRHSKRKTQRNAVFGASNGGCQGPRVERSHSSAIASESRGSWRRRGRPKPLLRASCVSPDAIRAVPNKIILQWAEYTPRGCRGRPGVGRRSFRGSRSLRLRGRRT